MNICTIQYKTIRDIIFTLIILYDVRKIFFLKQSSLIATIQPPPAATYNINSMVTAQTITTPVVSSANSKNRNPKFKNSI